MGQQRLRQLRHRRRLAGGRLGKVDPRQVDAGDQRLHPVGAREGGVGLEALQGGVEGRERLAPLGRARRGQGADDRLGVVTRTSATSRALAGSATAASTAGRAARSAGAGVFASSAASAFRRSRNAVSGWPSGQAAASRARVGATWSLPSTWVWSVSQE
jgi:hypothetical protein